MANISVSNISSNESSELGGVAFFLANIPECLPYVILLLLGAVIGILGNIMVVLTIIVNRELHSPTYILMFNLALTDIIVSAFVDPVAIFSLFIGENFFINRPQLCITLGSLFFLSVSASLFNLGFIAINRYINICHNSIYKKLFTTKLTLFYCVLIWVLAFLNSLPNLTGWNSYAYDRKLLFCLWNRKSNISYKIYLIIVNMLIPYLGIIFCYARIYVFAHKSNNRSNNSSLNRSIRLAKTLFASFLLYNICWMPIGLVVLFDLDEFAPNVSIVMYPMVIGFLNSSLNPIVYPVFNSNFRSACGNLFNKICCCCCDSFMNMRRNTISASGNQLSASNSNSRVKKQARALYNT